MLVPILICAQGVFVTLRSSENCRIQFRNSGVTVCFSEKLGSNRPESGCYWAYGTPKKFSPPLLDQKQSESRGSEKRIFHHFLVRRLSPAVPPQTPSLLRQWEDFRILVSKRITQHDPSGIFRRLLLDEKVQDSGERFQEQDLRLKGWVHHFSAAGIHLYVLISVSMSLAFLLFRAWNVDVSVAQNLARVLALTLGIAAWALAGFRWGWLRPWVVVLIRQFLAWRGIRIRWWIPLILALACEEILFRCASLIGLDVDSDFLMGRIHYALAVGGGLAAIESLRPSKRRTLGPIALSLGSWWTTAVWDLIHSGFTSIWTPLISFFSLGLMVGILYPVTLIAVLTGVHDLSWVADLSVVLERISQVQDVLQENGIPIWIQASRSSAILGFVLSAGILLIPHARKRQVFLGALTLGIVLSFLLQSKKPGIRISQWDVGQGDSAWVQSSSADGKIQTGFIDSGPGSRGVTLSTWISAWSRKRIRQIDWILLTHLDDDHAGGLLKWIGKIPIRCVVTAQAHWFSNRGRRIQSVLSSNGIQMRSTEDEKLSPRCVPFPLVGPTPSKQAKKALGNEAMTGILIPLNQSRIYVNFGDADSKQENLLLREAKNILDPFRKKGGKVIFKISHHGSRFSSSREFLKRLNPDEVWISSGIGNQYQHPHPDVLDRLGLQKTAVFRTDLSGAIDLPVRLD
ncbi:MAG: MBL fold metallo-hydrolase [Bdellovibrionales bacterium]|nr:MBL fold metallo-hydrolase [Bdellovibrionales bacterium]